jgi:hypothetical protein
MWIGGERLERYSKHQRGEHPVDEAKAEQVDGSASQHFY